MANEILLNKEVYQFGENDLPCLITYAEKAGGSQFSVSMVADLFLRGSKILFLTAYPMAKENILEQVKGEEAKIDFVTEESQLKSGAQMIILESGNENLFLKAAEKLDDFKNRVVFVKNMEVFGDKSIDICLKQEKLILSGDIDKSSAKEKIIKKQFKTIIVFTKPIVTLPFETPILEKYTGYLWSKEKEGFVSLKIDN